MALLSERQEMCPIRNKIRQKDSSEGEGGRRAELEVVWGRHKKQTFEGEGLDYLGRMRWPGGSDQ